MSAAGSRPGIAARLRRGVRLWPTTPRSFRIGSVILAFWLAVALAGPFLAPYGHVADARGNAAVGYVVGAPLRGGSARP